MNKKGKYALRGLVIGAAIKLVINGIKQYGEIQANQNKKFDWKEFLREGGKGGLIGGGIGLGIGALEDFVTANETPINTDEYLNLLVNTIRVDKNSAQYKASERKCYEIISFLEKEFGNDLSTVPFIWGSNAKGTAINGKSDFDIVVQFKVGTYSLEEMYNQVYNVFASVYKDRSLVDFRKQSKSVGLFFNIHGEDIRIDVVPIRETDKNTNNTSGNMFVRPNGIFSSSTYTKTDIGLQSTVNISPTQKKIIIALKNWRDEYNLPMSSYMIQLLVSRAYYANKYRIPKKFTDKLLMVVEFIRDNIEGIRLISIENTNNNVNNISEADKTIIADAATEMLDEIEYNPNYIKHYFSIP